MPFQNEYIPAIDQETSEFLKRARATLRTGHNSLDRWTADRDRNMVLFRRGGGHSLEDHNHDYWSFIDENGEYYFVTKLIDTKEASPDEISITRSFYYTKDKQDCIPSPKTIKFLKEALEEYKDWGIKSDYKRCALKLINEVTDEEA